MGTVNAGITYGNPDYLYWKAAKAAGLDLLAWDSGEYETNFMAKVVAHYTLEILERNHQVDAQNSAAKRRKR